MTLKLKNLPTVDISCSMLPKLKSNDKMAPIQLPLEESIESMQVKNLDQPELEHWHSLSSSYHSHFKNT